jgi:L-ascorbate metabolism protein UlaG (beta-lactamase superfamily)
VLTDPIWSERASPVGFAGPKRFWRPPLSLDELPALDAVVISHDHYDHLDQKTIEALGEREVRFFVPLGVGAHLERWGIAPERIAELDWWQQAKAGALDLVAVPARHFSGRHLTDRDHTLWASWVIKGPDHRVFFSGDTGYHLEFAEIGERFGPFDITLMESGAYNAQWRDSHIGPEQALRAHRELRGELLVPIHWGTYNLAFHAWTEPAERILAAAARDEVRVAIPRPGDSVLPDQPMVARWWPAQPWQRAEEAPVIASGIRPEAPFATCAPDAEPAGARVALVEESTSAAQTAAGNAAPCR